MPPDINENYDPPVDLTPERDRERESWDYGPPVDRRADPFWGPVERYQIPEPPIGTVLRFKVRHPGGAREYDYAALRAGDGKWYATGGTTAQGVSWEAFLGPVRERIVGPLVWMTDHRQVFL